MHECAVNDRNRPIRVGDKYVTNEGSTCTVVCAARYAAIEIVFDDTYQHRSIVEGTQLRDGRFSNPYHPTVWGKGFLGVGKHSAYQDGKPTKAYLVWSSMLARCYSIKSLAENPTYVDCSVSDEWLNFQNFAQWCSQQGKDPSWQLDKDILVTGNRIYSPKACRLVPRILNTLVSVPQRTDSKLPLGVSERNGMFYASLKAAGSTISYGPYPMPNLAFAAYRRAKKAHLLEVAEPYKDSLDPEILEALKDFEITLK